MREKAQEDSKLQEMISAGKLVSDELVFNLLEAKLDTSDKPYILDGSPRTVDQAIMYDKILEKRNEQLGVVIYLDVPKEELLKRVTTRLICPNCKKSYSTITKDLMPQNDGICDTCKVELTRRNDDKEEVFNERYEEYLAKTKPVIDYYEKLGVLHKINAINSNETYQQVLELIR